MTAHRIALLFAAALTLAACSDARNPGFQGWVEADLIFVSPDEYGRVETLSVREGDVVSAGQVVAQSGNSGRSTGPHLHLEARQNGRAIEIASLLKDPGMRADSYADRSHVRSAQ